MDSSAAVIAIVVAIIGVAGTVVGILLRNSRSSPETKDAQTNAWGQLNDRLNKHLDWLTTRVTNLESENASKNDRITDLDEKVAALESEVIRFRALTTWLRSRVTQLTNFITDAGSTPPDPPTPEPEP